MQAMKESTKSLVFCESLTISLYNNMRTFPPLVCIVLLATSAFGQTVSHRFLKSGCGAGSIAIVAKDGAVEWEYPMSSESSDSWLLPNGNLFFSFKLGVREVKPDKSTVWEFPAPAGSEIQGCQPLGDNLFLVAESRPDGVTVLYEMDRAKKINKTLELKLGGGAHSQARQIRKTPQGTYLVTQQRDGGVAMEFDGEGKMVRKFPGGRYVAERLPNGNTLIGCGDEHRVIEVDPQDKMVWEVKQFDVPGNTLGFAAGVVRLANGNTVICNWPGHGGVKDQPFVFEITPEKKVVWEVRDPKMKMISSIQILDEPTLTPSIPSKPTATPAPNATPAPKTAPIEQITNPPPSANQAPPVFNAEAAADLRKQGIDKLLFVRRYTLTNSHVYTEHDDARWTPGGGLCVLDLTNGNAKDLLPPEFAKGVVNRFDLSFDAKRVVFDFKKAPKEGYRIYELALESGAVRQLTFPENEDADLLARYGRGTNDMHPCYLPDGGIVFTSTRSKVSVLCHSVDGFTAPVLHRMDADGKNIQQLSHGALSEMSPAVLPDGRILYMRWEYNRKGAGAVKSLWSMHPDGSASTEVYGNQIVDPETMIYGRPVPGTTDKICFLGASHWGPNNGVGTVVLLDTKVDAASSTAMTFITKDVDARTHGGFSFQVDGKWVNENTGTPGRLFKDPYPLTENCFLAACKPKGRFWHDPRAYALVVLDHEGKDVELYRDESVSCWHPYPLKPRAIPPVPAVVTNQELAAKGLAHCVISNIGSGLPGVEPGSIKWIRVLEQVPRPWTARKHWAGKGDTEGMAHTALGPNLLGLQVQLGVVPVESDGSASFYVPADRNIYFQVLDSNFMAIQTERTFVNYRPGEIRSCTGCHERSHAPSNRSSGHQLAALQHPPLIPGPQPGESTGRRVFDYERQIQPLWDKHCISCHNSTNQSVTRLDLGGERTTLHNVSYDNLLGISKTCKPMVGTQVNENDVRAFIANTPPYTLGAHSSILAASISTFAPSTDVIKNGGPKPAEGIATLRSVHKDVKLTSEEFIQIVNWLDTGCQYYPSYWGQKNLEHAASPGFRPVVSFEEAVSAHWPASMAELYETKKTTK